MAFIVEIVKELDEASPEPEEGMFVLNVIVQGGVSK
jgi:hypothetical protein